MIQCGKLYGDSLINIAVKPFVANPFVSFGKFQQISQSHTDFLTGLHISYRRLRLLIHFLKIKLKKNVICN